MSTQTVRRWIMTGSVAAITATGTWYGAGLKMRQEFTEEKKTLREATPTERIQQLETTRIDLVRKKQALERKLADLAIRRPKTTDQPKSPETPSSIK